MKSELEYYIEEYEYYKNMEESLSNNTMFQRDAIISLEIPIELKMVLDKITDDVVCYDILEYVLRTCTDIVRQDNTINNHYRIIQDKILFYIDNYAKEYGAPIRQHISTVVYGVDALCRYLLTGIIRHKLGNWFFIMIERDNVLDSTIDVSICLETEDEIQTP